MLPPRADLFPGSFYEVIFPRRELFAKRMASALLLCKAFRTCSFMENNFGCFVFQKQC